MSFDEGEYYENLVKNIKEKVCQYATYGRSYGTFWPDCGRGSATCPRPQICEDHHAGCLRIDSFSRECMRMPGKPCPKNICPINQRDWEIEINSRKIRNAVKRYEKRKEKNDR